MPYSPEAIIAAINQRDVDRKRARRQRILLRAAELLRLAGVAAGFVYLTRNVAMPISVFSGVMLFVLLAHDRQKRWALEEELKKVKDQSAKAPAGSIL
jgi:hypothetical protein